MFGKDDKVEFFYPPLPWRLQIAAHVLAQLIPGCKGSPDQILEQFDNCVSNSLYMADKLIAKHELDQSKVDQNRKGQP